MKKLLLMLCLLMGYVTLHAATATVNGITWNYSVSNGEVTIGSGDWSSPAIPSSTSGAITIPSTLGGCPVTSIGDSAFFGCSSLTSVTIPEGVTKIGDSAFVLCINLTSVTIPSSVTSFGEGAFVDCFSLTSITIPKGVVDEFSIFADTFSDCRSLQAFNVAPENAAFASLNGLLLSKDGKTLLKCPQGLTSVTIPQSVTKIDDYAFGRCFNLTSVTIPSSVTSIGDEAFSACHALTSVTIPSSVKTIGFLAFRRCINLRSVTIPSSVTSMGWGAFSTCANLTSVIFKGRPPEVDFDDYNYYGVDEDQVFDGVFTATGYYLPEYAADWESELWNEELEIPEVMWEGIRMCLMKTRPSPSPSSLSSSSYQIPLPYPAASFTATPVGMEQVTLKVAAAKGYVFAGWHKDSAFTEACDSTLADYRNPTYTYNVGSNNVNFNAHFVTVEEDTKLDLVEVKEITSKGSDLRVIQLVIDSYSLPKVSVKGLPAGMKFTAKPVMKKGSKTEVEYPANCIYGTPTKPGVYTVTVSLTNATVKKAVTKTFTIEVPNLTAADKYFRYEIRNDEDDSYKVTTGVGDLSDLPSLRLKNSNNKLAVSGLPAGLKYDAKTGQIIGVPTKPGVYTVTLTVTEGKVKSISTITVEVEPLPEWVQGTFEGYSYEYGWYHDYFYQRYPDDPDYERIGRFTLTVSNTGKATIKTITASWSFALTAQLVEKIDEDSYYFVGESKKRGDKGRIAFTIERSEYDGTPRGMITDFMFDATESGNEMPYFIEAEAWENVWSNTSVSLPTIKKTQMFTQYYDETEGEIFGDLTLEFKANSNTVTSSFIFDVEIEDYDGEPLYDSSDNKTMKKCTAQIVITDYDAGLYSAIVPLYMKHLDDGEWIDLDFLVPLTIDESGDVEIDWDNVLHAHDDWADYYW